MRFVLVILLLGCLSLQCMMQLGIVAWYEMNKRAITEQYCVNKNRPRMHCNGKCHLKKQLEKTGDNQSREQNTSKKTDWAVFILPDQYYMLQPAFYPGSSQGALQQQHYSYLFLHALFRPPQVV